MANYEQRFDLPWFTFDWLSVRERIDYSLGIGRWPVCASWMLKERTNEHGCYSTRLGFTERDVMTSPCTCGHDCQGWARADALVAARRQRENAR